MKWLIALTVVIFAWFGLKDLVYSGFLTRGPATLPAPLTYDLKDHWAEMPETPPPGAWERPWGVDAFVVLPAPSTPRKHGLLPIDDEAVRIENLAALQKIKSAVDKDIPLYAPFYRAPSPANASDLNAEMKKIAGDDLMTAFDVYMGAHNRGRSVMVLSATPVGAEISPLLSRLQNDQMVSRFAGLVVFGEDGSLSSDVTVTCAEVLGDGCVQYVDIERLTSFSDIFRPKLPGESAPMRVLDPAGVTAAVRVQAENVSAWLDETQPKPAEPLSDAQFIEEAPIVIPLD